MGVLDAYNITFAMLCVAVAMVPRLQVPWCRGCSCRGAEAAIQQGNSEGCADVVVKAALMLLPLVVAVERTEKRTEKLQLHKR